MKIEEMSDDEFYTQYKHLEWASEDGSIVLRQPKDVNRYKGNMRVRLFTIPSEEVYQELSAKDVESLMVWLSYRLQSWDIHDTADILDMSATGLMKLYTGFKGIIEDIEVAPVFKKMVEERKRIATLDDELEDNEF